jgi:hypothetical protein
MHAFPALNQTKEATSRKTCLQALKTARSEHVVGED